ncbi:MAG: hypothetical protein H6701_08530 [Myxococcales bacterium]|nr:hypothetical protein [Myxococcales bacterium]
MCRGLAERVRRDPNPVVRLRALALLVAQFSGHAATAGALRAAAGDRDAMVRLAGARMLADGGRCGRWRGTRGRRWGAAGGALGAGERLPVEQWAVVLVEALDGPCAVDAARWLADRGWRAAAPALRGRVMAAGDEAATAFAGALGRLGGSAAEAVLLACLDRPGVRLAAVEALGAVGSVGALPGLLALTEGALLPGR